MSVGTQWYATSHYSNLCLLVVSLSSTGLSDGKDLKKLLTYLCVDTRTSHGRILMNIS